MCYLGQWGTVCDDLFGDLDAQVACRQLGFNTSRASAQQFAFGFGMGQIWLDDVQCRGVENRLVDCVHNGLGVHNCFRFEDVGITCPPGMLAYSTLLMNGLKVILNRCYIISSWNPSSC